MNLKQSIFTKNQCYILHEQRQDSRYVRFRNEGAKGIAVHDTSAGNPWLRRYVPDDGLLGTNSNNNHWNVYHPGGKDVGAHSFVDDGTGKCKTCGGREVCVHAFIGKRADGSIATYQTLPWNCRGLHAGSPANESYIGFEICDDGFTDAVYFNAVYKEAVEFCAYLCKLLKFDPMEDGVILGHYEAAKRGMGSDHGDPQVWFSHFGKSMDIFRKNVKVELDKTVTVETPAPTGSGDNPSAWAKEATEWAKCQKIFVGDGKGNYDWQEVVTREQVAQILYNSSK